MIRLLAVVMLLIPLVASGCTFQANNASQAVTFDPSQQQMFSPADGPGYMSGEPMNMRK
jgi:hypothetical protein